MFIKKISPPVETAGLKVMVLIKKVGNSCQLSVVRCQ